MNDSKFDLWLEKRPKLDILYSKIYTRTIGPMWGVWRLVRYWYPDWKDRRQFRPGNFFLDHGTHPCVVIRDKTDKDAVRGVSLVDGSFQLSDRYHCGPVPTTMKEANKIAQEMRKGRVMYQLEPKPMNGSGLFTASVLAKVAADSMLEEWAKYAIEDAASGNDYYPLTTQLEWNMENPVKGWIDAPEVLTAWYCKDFAFRIHEVKVDE
jgi:hypothetical protein